MRFKHRNGNFWFVCLVLTVSSTAYPYVDPGTGSMLLQLLTGGAVGIFMIVKMYWHKICGFFKKKTK